MNLKNRDCITGDFERLVNGTGRANGKSGSKKALIRRMDPRGSSLI